MAWFLLTESMLSLDALRGNEPFANNSLSTRGLVAASLCSSWLWLLNKSQTSGAARMGAQACSNKDGGAQACSNKDGLSKSCVCFFGGLLSETAGQRPISQRSLPDSHIASATVGQPGLGSSGPKDVKAGRC